MKIYKRIKKGKKHKLRFQIWPAKCGSPAGDALQNRSRNISISLNIGECSGFDME